MEHRIEIRQMFDEAFKRKVVEEYMAGGLSQASILKKYGIRFKGAIPTWMKKLGYKHQPTRRRTFARIKPTLVKENKPIKASSADSKEELLKKIALLQEQLEDEKLRVEMYSRIIDIAEKELKVPIRKKPDTK